MRKINLLKCSFKACDNELIYLYFQYFSPHDDSFFVLHAKDYDNLFNCPMLPEALNRLAVVYKLENDCELHLNVAER